MWQQTAFREAGCHKGTFPYQAKSELLNSPNIRSGIWRRFAMHLEAAIHRCLVKKLFGKISQNSKCGSLFSIKMQTHELSSKKTL